MVDPAEFDLAVVNARLQAVRWLRLQADDFGIVVPPPERRGIW